MNIISWPVRCFFLQGAALALGPSNLNHPPNITHATICCDMSLTSSVASPLPFVLQGVALALGPSKQPLPAYRAGAYHAAAASTSVGRYGDIGEHTGLIAHMSPVSIGKPFCVGDVTDVIVKLCGSLWRC